MPGDRGAGRELTRSLLRGVSRSFYLSVAVLPGSVRPTIGLAYLLARAADTIADTRGSTRESRIAHLTALRAELEAPGPGRVAHIVRTMAPGQAGAGERSLLQRLADCFTAYRALAAHDRERVGHLLATIIEGMIQDLRVFPGENEGKLEALATRQDLDRYTYLVAGCVGEFWTDVHAAHRARLRHWDLPRMRALGVRFGKGLQMTNILRDLPRDLRAGRCYLPRQDLARLGLAPRDLLDPSAGPAVRPLLLELLNLTLDHYEAGWQYTFAIPRRETRMRLACAWPLLIGLRTLDLLARTPAWLDPALSLKVPRARVYAIMTKSLATVWSTRALGRQARQLTERIRL